MKKVFLSVLISIIFYPNFAGAAWVDVGRDNLDQVLVDYGAASSLDLDSAGRPHIAFLQFVSGQPAQAKLCYLKWNGVEWVDADGSGQESKYLYNLSTLYPGFVSLKLKTNGNPAIAFGLGFQSNGTLYYLEWNGSAWVGADGSGGEEAAIVRAGNSSEILLVLKNNSYPAIVWSNGGTPSSIYYLEWNGGAWVDADGSGQGQIIVASGFHPSVALDTNDRPAISFRYSLMFTRGLAYLYWNGSAWVDADGSGQESRMFYDASVMATSLALDENSYPIIAWTLGSPGEINYLKWNGSAWVDIDGEGQEQMVVFTNGIIQDFYSANLFFDNNNHPHLGFRVTASEEEYDLIYLYYDGSGWVDIDGIGQESKIIWQREIPFVISMVLDDVNYYPHFLAGTESMGNGYIDYLEWWISRELVPLPQTGGLSLIFKVNQFLGLSKIIIDK